MKTNKMHLISTLGLFLLLLDQLPAGNSFEFLEGISDIVGGLVYFGKNRTNREKNFSDALNKLCSSGLTHIRKKQRETPDIGKMSFVLMTPGRSYSYPLLKTNELVKCIAFDRNKKTVILQTGWKTNLTVTPRAADTLAEGYFCRGDTNFLYIDTANYLTSGYIRSVSNTEKLGENIAKGLIELVKHVPLDTIHLIGYSLGAHIVGAVGRSFYNQTKTLIPRITGLDPANPCFRKTEPGLQRGDAGFVDIVHSNPGVLGVYDPIGDVDYYPGGLAIFQSGCNDSLCSHGRSFEYYAESVFPGNENNFMASKCSWTCLQKSMCCGSLDAMGYSVSSDLKGIYYSDVNSKKPYGSNSNRNNIKCNFKLLKLGFVKLFIFGSAHNLI